MDATPTPRVPLATVSAQRTRELEQLGGPRPAAGEWVCEQHPDQPWPHDGCDGPGMPARDA